jgi:hypothetical protein
LVDGPWCPDAVNQNRWDADLLRIRRVAITIRVEAALSALRGPAGMLFTNGARPEADPMGAGSEIRFRFRPQHEPGTGVRGRASEHGVAILVAMMALLLMAAIGGVLI